MKVNGKDDISDIENRKCTYTASRHMCSSAHKEDGYRYFLWRMNFMLLESFTKVHLGQLRATFSSLFCVAGVGRSIFTSFIYIYSILYLSLSKISKLLEGGNATGVRHSSMLGFYGERMCKRRNQTVYYKLNVHCRVSKSDYRKTKQD